MQFHFDNSSGIKPGLFTVTVPRAVFMTPAGSICYLLIFKNRSFQADLLCRKRQSNNTMHLLNRLKPRTTHTIALPLLSNNGILYPLLTASCSSSSVRLLETRHHLSSCCLFCRNVAFRWDHPHFGR